jgi:hypothetical protein
MQRRALFSLINIAVAAAAIVVLFAFPKYAGYAVYGFLAWFVVSLSVVWIARGTPSASARTSGGPAVGTVGAPLPSGSPSVPARPIGGSTAAPATISFCIYCAADLPPGTDRCPSCGRAVRPF